MLKYISKRILLLVITLVAIVTIVFFLLQLVKGLPAAIIELVGKAKRPEDAKSILDGYYASMGGHDALSRYAHYISGIFKHGDFGIYYAGGGESIPKFFGNGLKYTMLIVGPAFLIGTFFGIAFGFLSGYKRGKWQDITVNIIAVFFVAVPSFVLAMFLMLFGNKVGLPINVQDAIGVGKLAISIILPITIVSITSFSTLTYYIRNEVVEVLSSDYVAIARAKGVKPSGIFFKHVIRNVSIPLISIVLPTFVVIMAGSIVIEVFFGVPGTSQAFSTGVTDREFYIVLFSVIFYTSVSLGLQIFIDIMYVILDPRIKYVDKKNSRIIGGAKGYKSRRKSMREMEVKNNGN